MSPPRFEAAPADPSPLGTPLKYPVSGRSAPNRFLNAAMSEGLATFDEADPSKRGIPTEQLVQLYRRWGQGEWGQIQTGNVMIDPEHLEAPGNMVVPRDAEPSGERFDMFSKLAAAAKEHGSLIVAQVGHPGRQARGSVQQHPISASDVQLKQEMFGSKFGVPRPATKEDIKAVIEGFAHTAEYLEKAGFDGIELHAAHGYLLAQFLSETTNQRTDEYGGSLENRMRLILEVTAEVRRRTSKNFILGIKINSVEFQEKGFKPEEAVQLCEALEAAGMDFVETSGGTYESFGFAHRKESSRKRENYFIEFAEGHPQGRQEHGGLHHRRLQDGGRHGRRAAGRRWDRHRARGRFGAGPRQGHHRGQGVQHYQIRHGRGRVCAAVDCLLGANKADGQGRGAV
ncbi:hypothetical protein MCOR01_003401 [Pyricularia oryzae]|nr:hypothetical protein MCOR01_003401 [Pyricularia oryzae]